MIKNSLGSHLDSLVGEIVSIKTTTGVFIELSPKGKTELRKILKLELAKNAAREIQPKKVVIKNECSTI